MKKKFYIASVLFVWVILLAFTLSWAGADTKFLRLHGNKNPSGVKCKIMPSELKNDFTIPAGTLSNGSKLASAPLVSLEEARSYYNNIKNLPQNRSGVQTEQSELIQDPSVLWFIIPWGQEEEKLGHGLGCYDGYQTADAMRIYEWVRNHIDYEPSFGFVKGGEMTLLDGSGNAFDQATLLMDLLMMNYYDADYVYGVIQLTGEQFTNWMGIDDDPALAIELLADAGIPAEVDHSNGHIDQVRMQHMWVKLWAPDGSYESYALDPSFKEYQVTEGIDIGAAMGYDQTVFLGRTEAGMTVTSDYLQNMNRSNIRTDLAGYASNLVDYIETNLPGKGMAEIVGGREIIPVTGQPLPDLLPYELERFYEYNGKYEGRDWGLSTLVTISYQGYDHLFPAFEIYGERLTLSFTEEGGAYTARLFLDGVRMNSLDVTDPTAPLQISINHPYAANGGTYQDDVGLVSPKPGVDNLYVFSFGFGKTGHKVLEKHRKTIQELMLDSSTPDSEPDPVQGQALSLLGLAWMAQTSRAAEIGDALAGTHTIRHHSCGVVGQEASPMMDLPMSSTSVAGTDGSAKFGRFFTRFVTNSAFEGGTIAQIYGGQGASTVSLLDLANLQNNKIFNADSGNYATIVKPQLQGYTSEYLSALDSQIAAGDRLILSEHGDLQMGSYVGAGYYSLSADGYYQTLILGGLSGGYGTQPGILEPNTIAAEQKDYANAEDHPQTTEPIDLLTGYYLNSSLDLSVGGGRMPFGLSLVRSYNSGACKQDGPFGRGWSHNHDIQATAGSDGFRGMGSMSPLDAAPFISAIFVASDIFVDTLPFDRVLLSTLVNQWLMENLIDNVVIISGGHSNSRFVRMPDGSFRPQPDKWAQLEQETDGSFLLTTKHGNKLDFALDGRLSTWQDSNANTVTFNYSGGNLASVNNGLSKSLHFNYDGQQRISEVTDHIGRGVSYSYDTAGNLLTVTDPENHETRYEYDVPGRLTKIYNPADPVNPYVVNQYIDGNDIAYFRYQPMQVIMQTDPSGNVFSYYFAAGRRSEEIDPDGNSRVLYFDERGRNTVAIDPMNFEISYTYDGLGRLIKTVLPERNGYEYEYDRHSNKIVNRALPRPDMGAISKEIQYTFDPTFNRKSASTDPLGHTTSYIYDMKGNIERIQLPMVDSAIPEYNFTTNSHGQVVNVAGPEGMNKIFAYNATTGELTSATTDAGGLNLTTSYAYDAVGNLTAITDPRGNTFTFGYNDNRQVVKQISPPPFNYEKQYGYDAGGTLISVRNETDDVQNPWQTSSATYTLSGGYSTITDPENHLTTYQYDITGKLWRVTNAENHTVEYLYDPIGRPFQQIDPLNNVIEEHTYTPNGKKATLKDINGNITTYEYDSFDRLFKEIAPDGSYSEFVYDDANNLTQKRTRSGGVISYSYDGISRMRSKTLPGPRTVNYSYDELSRLVDITDDSGTIRLSYDAANRCSSVVYQNGKTVTYEYDAEGNRTRLTYPDGYFITYTYDMLNRLEQIYENGTTLLAQYVYDALSRRTAMTYANGASAAYGYTGDNRMITLEHNYNGGSLNFTYSYNAIGNLTRTTVNDSAFTYLPATGSTNSYTVNNLNQYDTVDSIDYDYDISGNLISVGINTNYIYDIENKLVSAETAGHSAGYAYNALGQRTDRTVDGVTTSYVYDGLHLLMEYDADGNPVKRYIYGPNVDEPLMMQTEGENYFFHRDGMGSVVALSNIPGDFVETYAYSPFGEPNKKSSIGNRFMYSGREYDDETGLLFYRTRYYSPALGRFLSADPVGPQGGTLNLYSYVFNNPLNLSDPLGLTPALTIHQKAIQERNNGIEDVMKAFNLDSAFSSSEFGADPGVWLNKDSCVDASERRAELIAGYLAKHTKYGTWEVGTMTMFSGVHTMNVFTYKSNDGEIVASWGTDNYVGGPTIFPVTVHEDAQISNTVGNRGPLVEGGSKADIYVKRTDSSAASFVVSNGIMVKKSGNYNVQKKIPSIQFGDLE